MPNENIVPSPKNQAAKFAFFYILSLVSLVFVAVACGMVIFQIINKQIIDVINEYSGNYSDEMMRLAISALTIATPIFYLTIKNIYRSLYKGTLDKDSGVRKWLTYLIILVAIIVMIAWLIETLNSFLSGELTNKFLLKSLTSIVIAGAIFSFFLYDIRREQVAQHKDKVIRMAFYGSLAFILAIFVSALLSVDSPQVVRQRKIDQQIINDFHQISYAIDTYYQEKRSLPKDLAELKDNASGLVDSNFSHPQSQEAYVYNVTGEKEYELCATFLVSNVVEANRDISYGYVDKNWIHEAGYQCIKQKIQLTKIPGDLVPPMQ